jgi:glycosyltransferase involved in cell wall biosynthesis
MAQPSSFYQPTGQGILWYHYSIYSNNLEIAAQSHDYTIMDFHGVTPPHLFAGQEPYLQKLCQQALDRLPQLTEKFDLYVVHSEYTRDILQQNGYAPELIHKLPLVLDNTRFAEGADPDLSADLAKLDYLLFIGRIVPQKDILAMLDIFAEVQRHRPHMVLMLVGSRHLAPNYQKEIDRKISKMGLESRVMFVGQVNNPTVLAALLGNAKFLIVTSEWETFCVPVVESLSFGVPPVVQNVAPLPEVAGNAGIIVDKTQPRQAAQKILRLLDNQGDYAQLKNSALTRVKNFTDRALEKAMLEMLASVFAHHV